MPIIRCPKCDDPVEIEDDWFGRHIACPACDHQFTPRRSRGNDFDDEDDRRPRRDDRDEEVDRRPRRRSRGRDYDDRPAKKGGNAVLWVVLALVGVFVVLPCLSCIGFVIWGMNAKETFDGPWADHTVTGADGQPVATAAYPKPPTPKPATVAGTSGGQLIGYDHALDGTSPLDVIFAVGYFDFPAGGGDPLTTHFDAIRSAVEDAMAVDMVFATTLASDTRTRYSGYPTREAIYSEEDGRYTLRVVHLDDRPPGATVRLVVVFAGGMNMKDEDKQKFLNSVKIAKGR